MVRPILVIGLISACLWLIMWCITHRAVRIATGNELGYVADDVVYCCWRDTEHALIFIRNINTGSVPAIPQRNKAFLWNRTKRTASPLPNSLWGVGEPWFAASPGAEYVAGTFRRQNANSGEQYRWVGHPDGSDGAVLHENAPEMVDFVWYPDGRRIAGLTSKLGREGKFWVFDRLHPEAKPRTLSHPSMERYSDGAGWLLGFNSHDQAIAIDPGEGSAGFWNTHSGSVSLYFRGGFHSSVPTVSVLHFTPVEIGVAQPAVRSDIVLPSGVTDAIVSLSPDRLHLAWMTWELRYPVWQLYLMRLFPSYSPQGAPKPVVRLLMSSVDGSNLREIVAMEASDTANDLPRTFEPSWLPDGKSISFFHDRNLYLVPVD